MKKYNIYKTTKEIKERNMCDIVEGCTVSGDDIFSELVKSCDTLEEAGETLKRYKTDITPYDGCYLVTEYCVLPEIYDEEWNVVKTFDNLKEADDFIHSDERELTLIY